MPRFKSLMSRALSEMGKSPEEIGSFMRANQVRQMWERLMKAGGDDYILAHTNNVFILREGEARPVRRDHDDRKDAGATGKGKKLIVYVDESIVAAELNARRELVKLQFFEFFGEEIDEFKILISRGQYKSHHPFAKEDATPSWEEHARPVPLDETECATVTAQVAGIEDERLRKAVERAMRTDLEWKKGLAEQDARAPHM